MSDLAVQAEEALVDLLERLRGAPLFKLESAPASTVRTGDEIIAAVERVTGVAHVDFMSPRRWKTYCEARQIAYWFMRHFTSMSFPQIGWTIGQRHHSTVMHGVNKVNEEHEYFGERVKAVAKLLKVNLPEGTPFQ